jgi:hypothetical protein
VFLQARGKGRLGLGWTETLCWADDRAARPTHVSSQPLLRRSYAESGPFLKDWESLARLEGFSVLTFLSGRVGFSRDLLITSYALLLTGVAWRALLTGSLIVISSFFLHRIRARYCGEVWRDNGSST